MNLDSAVLVVVDVQNGFVRDKSQHVVPVIGELVDRWKATGRPVVFTRYINYPNSPYERLIGWSRMHDSPSIDIVDGLADRAATATVIDKTIYSLFSPEGSALVQQNGWTDLVICGIATENCVLKTAVDAFEKDLNPWVVTDASASHAGENVHEAGLLVTGRFIGKGQLITTSDVYDSLASNAPVRAA